MTYLPVKKVEIKNGDEDTVLYRVALQNKAIMMFEELSKLSFLQLISQFESANQKNSDDADGNENRVNMKELFKEFSYRDILTLVYCCMINAKKFGSFNSSIETMDDLIDANIDMIDMFTLFITCFQTMDSSKAAKLAKQVGK